MNYVIILGHEMDSNGLLSNNSIARVDSAVRKFGCGDNVTYIVSGGVLRHHWPMSLADAIAERLRDQWAAKDRRIMKLQLPQDTVGEAVFSRLALLAYHKARIHVVTQQYHSKRVQYIFDFVFGNENVSSYIFSKNETEDQKQADDEQLSLATFRKSFEGVKRGDIHSICRRLYQCHPLYKETPV